MEWIKKNKRALTIILSAVIVLCAAALILIFLKNRKNNANDAEAIGEILKSDEIQEQTEESTPELDEDIVAKQDKDADVVTLDFDKIRLQNADIYAWIEIPGTDVDYPVLQNQIDNYYLQRNLDGSSGLPACLYSNASDNKTDFSDFVHVIYGHNMKDESMFGSLRRFYDKSFFDENSEIIVYTEKSVLRYEIVACRRHSDEYLFDEFDFSSVDGKKKFVEMMRGPLDDVSHIRDESEFSDQDMYIVLSTCIGNEDSNRFLVFGRLVECQ